MAQAALVAGAILLVAAPLLLRRAWRRGARESAARAGGWLALAGALVAFAVGLGMGRGIALALALLPLAALPIVYLGRDRREAGRRPVRHAAPVPGRPRWWRATGRLAVALPLAGSAAVLAAADVSPLWGTMTAGVLASLALAIVLWAAFMLWALSDPRLAWAAAGLGLIALAGGAWLALS